MTKQEALDWAGGVTALAERLGITHGAVSQWDEVPKDKQYDIQALSGGKLRIDERYQLGRLKAARGAA